VSLLTSRPCKKSGNQFQPISASLAILLVIDGTKVRAENSFVSCVHTINKRIFLAETLTPTKEIPGAAIG